MSGRIHIVQSGILVPRENVLERWRQTLFLRAQPAETRGWLIEVMKCVDIFGEREFGIDEVYAFEPLLARLYPGNHNVRPKIRQQLQVLRDSGYLELLARGRYRRILLKNL
jgi:type II restriction enzyme